MWGNIHKLSKYKFIVYLVCSLRLSLLLCFFLISWSCFLSVSIMITIYIIIFYPQWNSSTFLSPDKLILYIYPSLYFLSSVWSTIHKLPKYNKFFTSLFFILSVTLLLFFLLINWSCVFKHLYLPSRLCKVTIITSQHTTSSRHLFLPRYRILSTQSISPFR